MVSLSMMPWLDDRFDSPIGQTRPQCMHITEVIEAISIKHYASKREADMINFGLGRTMAHFGT